LIGSVLGSILCLDITMTTYIALLRGINVSGKNKIDMGELKAAFESLGFHQVKSYIQSGNVIFNSAITDKSVLKAMIQEKIGSVFGFPITAILRTLNEILLITKCKPLPINKEMDIKKLYVTFLSDIPIEPVINPVEENHKRQDEFIILNQEVFIYCPNGYRRTKFSNDYFEKKLGVLATTRNWRTVIHLVDIASN
jgi:uncharacterized protein (DUF1697 family)